MESPFKNLSNGTKLDSKTSRGAENESRILCEKSIEIIEILMKFSKILQLKKRNVKNNKEKLKIISEQKQLGPRPLKKFSPCERIADFELFSFKD